MGYKEPQEISIFEALLTVMETLEQIQQFNKKLAHNKHETQAHLTLLRQRIRLCKQLLKECSTYPMLAFEFKPAKQQLDAQERKVKQELKRMNPDAV